MNASEELTSLIAQKFFFQNHIWTNVLYSDKLGEKELCDILIEFVDCYICVQVKEKDESGESNDWDWFSKKVLKDATKQVRESLSVIQSEELQFYVRPTKGDCAAVKIDCHKPAIPIVVFCNSKFGQYERFHFSKTLNKPINIFSYEDFCTMLNTIVLPYDIVSYILQRSRYIPAQGGKRFIFEDVTDDVTIISTPQSEKDYADLYLARNYYDKDIHPEFIVFYNEFLSMIYDMVLSKDPKIFDMLFCADMELANRIVKFYSSTIETLCDEHWDCPLFVYDDKDSGMLFIRKPPNGTTAELKSYIQNFGTYFSYKHHLIKIHFLIFERQDAAKFTMNFGGCEFHLPAYDPELEKTISELDKYFKSAKS